MKNIKILIQDKKQLLMNKLFLLLLLFPFALNISCTRNNIVVESPSKNLMANITVEKSGLKLKLFDSNKPVINADLGKFVFDSDTLGAGYQIVEYAKPFDFKLWYNDSTGLISPFLESMIKTDTNWVPILKSGKTTWREMEGEYAAVAELKKGKGVFRICQLQLNNRVNSNPTAKKFAYELMKND